MTRGMYNEGKDMKPLDEVIEDLEICRKTETLRLCIMCNTAALHYLKKYRDNKKYYEEKTNELVADLLKVRDDEQRIAEEFARYQEAVKNCEAAENRYKREEKLYKRLQEDYLRELNGDNPVLTWDELKEMGGRPVWIKFGNDFEDHKDWIGIWRIVSTFTGRNEELACMNTAEDYPSSFFKKNMGVYWEAYRKETYDY